MSIRAKQYVTRIETNSVVISASTVTATIVASFNVESIFDFTISVHSSETACVFPYVIQSAPVLSPASFFSQITATSVHAGSAGGVTKNTFEYNNQAWVRVIMTSASDVIAVGALSVILSSNER